MKQIQEDKIISEFLKSLGPWREFVVIGGGFALFIYKLYLTDPKLENLPVGTLHESSSENPDPFSCVIATSFGFHYGEMNEPAVPHDHCMVLPTHTKYPLPEVVLADIDQSVARYGMIPDEI